MTTNNSENKIDFVIEDIEMEVIDTKLAVYRIALWTKILKVLKWKTDSVSVCILFQKNTTMYSKFNWGIDKKETKAWDW